MQFSRAWRTWYIQGRTSQVLALQVQRGGGRNVSSRFWGLYKGGGFLLEQKGLRFFPNGGIEPDCVEP